MCELESLSDHESFYCPEWPSVDFPKTGELVPRAADPSGNVATLLNRVRAVYELATETFPYCSGVYAGKSSRTRVAERFSLHRAKVKGKAAAVVLVVLSTFSTSDVPAELVAYQVEGEVFALLHENLITKAIRASGLPEYREEAIAGGGRVGAHDVGLLYMLLVVSREPLI